MDAWKSSKKRMFSVTDDMQNLLLEGEIGCGGIDGLILSGVRDQLKWIQVIVHYKVPSPKQPRKNGWMGGWVDWY